MTTKRLAATVAAASALLLAAPAFQPALADGGGCLRFNGGAVAQPVPEASRKPRNLAVTLADSRGNFDVTWDIPGDMPRDVLTGHCLRQRHVETGSEKTVCNRNSPTRTLVGSTPCYAAAGGLACYRGVHSVKVKFTTDCNVDMPYSDAVDRRHGTYSP